MKARTIGIVAAAGLAGLVGINSAQAQSEEQYPLIVRTEIPGGYILDRIINSNYGRDVSFMHECVAENGEQQCNDQLVWAINTSQFGKIYNDFGSDGIVEIINEGGSYVYFRGDRGTEQMFNQADAYLKQIKEELDVK